MTGGSDVLVSRNFLLEFSLGARLHKYLFLRVGGENWFGRSISCILPLFSVILFVDLLIIRFASNVIVLLEEVLFYGPARGKNLLQAVWLVFESNPLSLGYIFCDVIGVLVSTNLPCL